MLQIEHLTKKFGGLAAVNDVTTTIEQGKINAIIGPNGAGKTTFFNLISSMHKPTSGTITFDGQDVTSLRPDQVARLGVARTFQTTALFDRATVLDNLIVGHRLRTQSGLWDVLRGSSRLREEERVCREKAREALDFVGLSPIANRVAGDISQEERKRVAFALALATDPKLMLLDEPAGGVNPEDRRPGRADPQDRAPWHHGGADRTQDGHDHEPGRQDPGAELRRKNRRRHTRRDPPQPCGDRCLPGERAC
jgi:branched-chain amino acid transport system ATP-binding protein